MNAPSDKKSRALLAAERIAISYGGLEPVRRVHVTGFFQPEANPAISAMAPARDLPEFKTEEQEIRGFVLLVDQQSLALRQKRNAANPDKTETMPLSGTVFYINPSHTPKELQPYLQEGEDISVMTCLPADSIRDTVVFDKLMIKAHVDPEKGICLSLRDPRPPQHIPGTPEYRTQIRAMKYSP